jgi:hypothetical protein
MICKVDKRLSGLSNLLSYSARLVTIKAVISAMPNHAMCAIKVHNTNLEHIQKVSRQFLWHGKEIDKHGKCLVSWNKVCLPKKAGGLGVLDLKIQNKALQIKNLYKFYNKQDIPWVNLVWQAYYQHGAVPIASNSRGSFWWRDCMALIPDFKQLTSCSPGNAKSIMLWNDKWGDNILKDKYPHLFSFTKKGNINVLEAYNTAQENIFNMFYLPLSMIAAQQCDELSQELNNLHLDDMSVYDKWNFAWSSNKYSTQKVYLALINAPVAPAPFKWIWKSSCLPKHKFFFWLLIQDRLNTKMHMLKKKFFVGNQLCMLCNEDSHEDMLHLFFQCDFSRNFWWKIGEEWNTELEMIDMLMEAKNRSTNHFFKEAMIAGCWSIWNQRNSFIFDGKPVDLDSCFAFFKESISLIRHRVRPSLREGMQDWLDIL